jgi:replicative DNA helicase
MSTAKKTNLQLQVAKYPISETILLPQNLELEEIILGAILLDHSAFKVASRILTKDSFHKYSHQTVWEAYEKLTKKSQPIDLLTVNNTIRESGLMEIVEEIKKTDSAAVKRKKSNLQKFGITSYQLVNLTNRVASAANLEHHSRILYQFQMRRGAISTAYEILRKAVDMTEDIFDTYDAVAKEFRSKNPQNVLTYKSMNQTMIDGAKEPPARRMTGSLTHENSIIILFSDPGTGKSIFGMQIADMISRGKGLWNHKDFQNSCKPKKTVVFDFEMEESELYGRYKKDGKVANAYNWHKNFFRSGINPDFIDLEEADTLITNEMQLVIEEQEPELVIVDNMTYIASESSDPKMATKIMKKLLAMQKRSTNQMTIIVIAHTPKRDPSLPIELRHLAGAKALSNFAKTVIAISKSKLDPGLRYIKQLKVRQDIEVYTQENVIVCGIDKAETGRLEYQFRSFGKETEHLVTPDIEQQEPALLADCLEKHKSGKYSWRQLADYVKHEYGITMTHTTIYRKVKDYAFDAITETSEIKSENEILKAEKLAKEAAAKKEEVAEKAAAKKKKPKPKVSK